ncbi:MAG: N-acetyltransferase [Chloroflexia bacterium]|nr:N-acetyltransferase [Chloroflexia bacterium]
MIVRDETQADIAAIREVVDAAFPGPAEARLVDLLRADGGLTYSLVAVEAGRLVGHVAFSPMTAPFRALGLGPIAVTPDRQRTGIGRRLIEAGLARATRDGWQAVFLLGDPRFYERFGFSVERAAGYTTPYAGPHWMVVALGGEPLPTPTGEVAYAPAFARLDG